MVGDGTVTAWQWAWASIFRANLYVYSMQCWQALAVLQFCLFVVFRHGLLLYSLQLGLNKYLPNGFAWKKENFGWFDFLKNRSKLESRLFGSCLRVSVSRRTFLVWIVCFCRGSKLEGRKVYDTLCGLRVTTYGLNLAYTNNAGYSIIQS